MQHQPVLLEEVVRMLSLRPGMKVVDATAGLGGHAKAIGERIKPGGELLLIDKDLESLEKTKEFLQKRGDTVKAVHSDYRHIKDLMRDHGWNHADAILLDAGVSSTQLDDPERGFSFNQDGPLDMRMDRSQFLKASDILNHWSEEEIDEALALYGEERYHRRLARAICRQRQEEPFETISQLNKLIRRVLGGLYRNQKIHPATRSFQALRICVNDEQEALKEFLEQAIQSLSHHGRIAAISFHSLEDRLVKHTFRKYAKKNKNLDWGGGAPCLEILTRKPVSPSQEEIRLNKRSRSAKLRVAERIE